MSLDKHITSDSGNLLQAKFGHWERSESVLQRLRGKNADVSQEATEIRVYIYSFFIRRLTCGKE